MDRAAIFVDAGYVYAQGGLNLLGTKSRAEMDVNAAGFVAHLEQCALTLVDVPLLRTYWYDGAFNRVATADQHEIARLRDVKLRLGTLNSARQQKGVDALLYQDLITLAREKAISDAIVVSGDADLCEGIRAAQQLGVRVTVVGLASTRQRNQAKELIEEADRSHTLVDDDLKPFFQRRPGSSPRPKAQRHEAPHAVATGSVSMEKAVKHDESDLRAAAANYAEEWASKASPPEIARLLAGRPRIPTPLDADLLRAAEAGVGQPLRGDQPARHEVRAAFWQTIERESAQTADIGAGQNETDNPVA